MLFLRSAGFLETTGGLADGAGAGLEPSGASIATPRASLLPKARLILGVLGADEVGNRLSSCFGFKNCIKSLGFPEITHVGFTVGLGLGSS